MISWDKKLTNPEHHIYHFVQVNKTTQSEHVILLKEFEKAIKSYDGNISKEMLLDITKYFDIETIYSERIITTLAKDIKMFTSEDDDDFYDRYEYEYHTRDKEFKEIKQELKQRLLI